MSTALKDEAKRLIDGLPEDATWEDLMYAIYVRQKIDSGLRDLNAGRALSDEEMKRRFGLTG